MEWNKDQALKAKEIAEKKITEMDVNGALRFAVRAQKMYPTLDGLSQLLATVDIYVCAENKINGEVDWYRVLGVQPSADDETIRESYSNLAFILTSDKNKAVGSDGAFRILSEAWSVLSDKMKRISYDQRRNWGSMQEIDTNGKLCVPQNHDRFCSPGPSNQNFSPSDWIGATHLSCASAPPLQYKTSFWTVCNACEMKFEFMSRYVNQHLRCPNCRQSFVATEILPPPSASRASSKLQKNSSKMVRNEYISSKEQLCGKAHSMGSRYSDLSGKLTPSYGVLPQFGNATTSSSPALSTVSFRSTFFLEPTQRTHISMQTDGGLSGMPSNANFTSRLEAGGPRKKRQPLEPGIKSGIRKGMAGHMFNGIRGGGLMAETGTMKIGGASYSNSLAEMSNLQIRSLLTYKARTDIQKMLSELGAVNQVTVQPSSSKKKVKEQHKEMENASSNGMQADVSKLTESTDVKDTDQTEKPSCVTSTIDMEVDCMGSSMSVPDPDFYDFDKNRTESSFDNNQIWAMYDDDDGMPRYYALVHNLISTKPFKIRISWLSSKSNLEFSPVKWVGSGFPKTCGELRIGKSGIYNSLNSFSHRVKWTKGPRGIIQIYPLKGDVWALYRNWSPDWNEFTADEIIHSYDMVEVLEDYSEDCGVTVAPLVKVPGFRTVFQKHLDPSKTWKVSRGEMFRFSHQVPSYKLSGQEAAHAPKGCWELDPASTPLELLQIVTECSKEGDVSSGPKMPMGEHLINGNIGVANLSQKDAEKKEAAKEVGGVQEKKLLVYERRRRGGKQNIYC